MAKDLVNPLKFESDEGDFGPAEADATEDYLNAKGFTFEGNEDVAIDKDISGNMQFEDQVSGGPHTLADLLESASGGVTASQHKSLDQLVHMIAETNHEDWSWSGWKPTSIINWTDNGKTLKIREALVTWNGWRVNTIVYKQYNGSGALQETLTGTFTWDGWKIDFIEWSLT